MNTPCRRLIMTIITLLVYYHMVVDVTTYIEANIYSSSIFGLEGWQMTDALMEEFKHEDVSCMVNGFYKRLAPYQIRCKDTTNKKEFVVVGRVVDDVYASITDQVIKTFSNSIVHARKSKFGETCSLEFGTRLQLGTHINHCVSYDEKGDKSVSLTFIHIQFDESWQMMMEYYTNDLALSASIISIFATIIIVLCAIIASFRNINAHKAKRIEEERKKLNILWRENQLIAVEERKLWIYSAHQQKRERSCSN